MSQSQNPSFPKFALAAALTVAAGVAVFSPGNAYADKANNKCDNTPLKTAVVKDICSGKAKFDGESGFKGVQKFMQSIKKKKKKDCKDCHTETGKKYPLKKDAHEELTKWAKEAGVSLNKL